MEHTHQWHNYPGDEVACSTCGIAPYQLNGEPVDDCHAISIAVTAWIRQEVAMLRAEASRWQPAPYHADSVGSEAESEQAS